MWVDGKCDTCMRGQMGGSNPGNSCGVNGGPDDNWKNQRSRQWPRDPDVTLPRATNDSFRAQEKRQVLAEGTPQEKCSVRAPGGTGT